MFLAGLAMVWSCGLEQIGGDDETGGDVWFGPGGVISGDAAGSGTEGTGVCRKVWYAVGVDYPDGYDWRSDRQKGSVRCSLVVFANGVPMMKVPVGVEYEVSDDPDMHRMLGKSLYTDYSTDHETVIKKDGEQIFRYEGREMIVDMVTDGDDVYTLGLSRDGYGFSFRRNGEVLLERSAGYAFPRIQKGDAGWCFAFCETIGSDKGAPERYYLYSGGNVSQVAVREDVKMVWDIILDEGKVCYLASMVAISTPVLAVGDDMKTLDLPTGSEVMSCRFVSGEGLNVEGVVSQKGKVLFSALWKGNTLVKQFSPGYMVASMCMGGEEVCCVLNGPYALADGVIYRCGESLNMPEGYISMGGSSMFMSDGMLYVGLTSTGLSKDACSAAVWIDNEMKPLKINGFISHISVN